MDNFAADFQNLVNTCVENNREHKPDNVRFTYNFSLLIDKWFEMQQCYPQILGFSDDIAAVEDFRCLMRSINRTIFQVKQYAIEGYTFTTLKDSEQIVVDLAKIKASNLISCQNNLQDLSAFMQNAVNILCSHDSNIRETEFTDVVKNMFLFVQGCVEGVESVVKQMRSNSANLNKRTASSCIDNATSRRVNATAQLRRAYFADFNQNSVPSCIDNATSRRVNATAQLRRAYFADFNQNSVPSCIDNATSRRVNATAQLRRAYFASFNQSSVSSVVNTVFRR
ncbi:hypothetical protein K6025_04950 [Ehrlichia sp. JZT12]